MKLREIIKLSAIMLSNDDVLNGTKLYDESYDILDEQSVITSGSVEERTLNLLMRCFNLAYSELATDYFSLVTTEKIEIKDGTFDLNLLEQNFYKLVKLENESGDSVKCEVFDNTLYAEPNVYSLIYSFIPAFATLNTELNNFNGKVSERIFVYGLIKEYCFISGLYGEAESYKTKFEEAIKYALRLKKNVYLKNRRWE